MMFKIINWSYLIIKWFLFLIINQVTNLISFPLAPIVVLFAKKDGWLPVWLWWFQTPDNSLDGDGDWKTMYRIYKIENTRFKKWVNRWRWLWRNRLCGFSQSVLGIKFISATDVIEFIGDINIGNGLGAKAGWFFKTSRRGQWITGFQWYYIRQYKSRPQSCIRILVGWKLPRPESGDAIGSFGFSPSPMMHFNS